MYDQLNDLGFVKVATKVKEEVSFPAMLQEAYKHYPFITPEAIKKFNEELFKKTRIRTSRGGGMYDNTYDKLVFCKIADYPSAPPKEVLDDMQTAKDRGCFDTFEIGLIESIKEVEDPILFGRVKGCNDLFFVSQWDNDVKFEDLVKATDGKEFLRNNNIEA